MSANEQPTSLPEELTLLDENKSIVALNEDYPKLLNLIQTGLALDKYNSLVTASNLPSMKKTATELNGLANKIDTFRKDKKNIEMEDINKFDSNLVECRDLIKSKRQAILDGISKAEEQTLLERVETAKNFLEACYNKLNLREEFKTVTVDDMVQKKYFTIKEALATAGKNEIITRVNEKNQLQTKVDNRILSLENECLKANIVPLTVEHIQGFLYADDETYNKQLNSLIQVEIERNEAVKEQEKIKAEQEAKQKIIDEQKAEKAELEARYLSRINTADKADLLIIGVELQSYSGVATYELKQRVGDRQRELEEQKSKVEHEVDEVLQEEHLRSIASEPVKQEVKQSDESNTEKKAVDGKIEKTLSIKIRVPEHATNEQVIGAVINMIKADTFPIENIEVN